MLEFINEQLGRIMLVAAMLATAASVALNRWPEPEKISAKELKRDVLVEFKKETVAMLNAEVFFSPDRQGKENEQFWCDERGLFEPEKKVKPFVPVELELPPARVLRPPQVLPEPGPSLEGSDSLPRYGDEFPPLSLPPPALAPTPGTAPTTAPAPVPGTKPTQTPVPALPPAPTPKSTQPPAKP